MASYAALASLIDLLDEILHHSQYQKFLSSRYRSITNLHKKVSLLLDSLQDYSSKGDETADRVEKRIRDAAYQAQDILECEISKQIDSEIPKESDSGLRENSLFKFNSLGYRLILACQNSLRLQSRCEEYEDDLLMVGREVDSIVELVKAIKKSQAHEDLQLDYAADAGIGASELTPAIGGNTMVGFEEYAEVIKEQLCRQSSQLQVIPIVGMGGIGKTTLARNIFDDALIAYEFDFRGWVTISQDYDMIRVLQNIIISLNIMTRDGLSRWEMEELEKHEGKGEALEEEPLDEHEALEKRRKKKEEELEKRRRRKEIALKNRIHKYLCGRKYLITIDDVWNTNVWDDLKQIFPNECKGSRILLTTRLKDVAEYAGTHDILHELQFLRDDESWDLLQNKVFTEGHCPSELVDTGRFISSKCQGLPLAIVVIAGILSNDTTLGYWKMIAKNVGSVLSRDGDHLSNILSLSYNHLQLHLKACFLHMGSFPEDYEISISKLIRLWIAEGFLKSVSTSKSLEKVGEEYLEDLVKRSLVIVTKKKANGQFKFCVMHDLLRDFCRERGVYECFFPGKDRIRHADICGAEKIRRIILNSATCSMPWAYENGKFVRSICWFGKTSSNVQGLEWDSVKLLRILDVADIETLIAPFAFSQMFHLKYLALRLGTKKKKHFPQSISKFQNLQSLIIHAPICEAILLPHEIWNMPQLRHLIIDRMVLPPIPTVGDIPFQKLEHLQTLETVEDFVFTDEVTSIISSIKKLKLRCHGKKASGIWNQYCLNYLVTLLQLEKLNIAFDAQQVLYVGSFRSSFVFPQNLKKLSLEGCGLPWGELMAVGSLPCLEVLRLRKDSFVGPEWETVEGQFLKLHFLLMDSLNLKQWKAYHEHFPCLVHLKINKCSELEEIPLDIGEIPTLKYIDVHFSWRAGNSANKILKEQQDLENNELQVLVHD